MAGRIAYYGNIVKDGLVLLLDAAKKDSYPGSGTLWRDVSGNGNNGTLINGPTFNSDNGGSVVFDGVNDYVGLGNPSSLNILGNITVSSWVKLNTFPSLANPFYTIYEKGYDNFFDQTYFRVDNISGVVGVAIGTFRASNNTSYQTRYLIGSNIVLNTWYNIVGQYDGANWRLYLNGSLVSTTLQNQSPLSSTSPSSIGAAYISNGYSRFLNGEIAGVSIYNRALSATEVLQNYNATKGRYL